MKPFHEFGIDVAQDGTGEVRAVCPQCSAQRKKPNDKCLSVNYDKQVWHCFHCGFAGSTKQGIDKRSLEYKQDRTYDKPKSLVPKTPRINPQFVDFFQRRGISEKTLAENQIFTQLVYMPQLQKSVAAVGFPYFLEGEHINTKWRDINKNFRFESGCQLTLQGIDNITADTKSVIWVEGEMDRLAMWEAGFKNVVSIPDGAPSEKAKDLSKKFEYLEPIKERLHGKSHYLFVDNDKAGKRLQAALADRLGIEHCLTVKPPDNLKDANDVLMHCGKDIIHTLIECAEPLPLPGVYKVTEFKDALFEYYEYGFPEGISTGWKTLDQLFTVREGELTVLTGVPNSGKSTFLDCLLLNLSYQGWKAGIYSPENRPLQRHMAGMIHKMAKCPFKDIRKEFVPSFIERLNERFFWVLPADDADYTLDGILRLAALLAKQQGIKAFVIDPWNEVNHKRPNWQNEHEYIGEALSRVKRFAQANGVHVFIVAHPTKLRKQGNDKWPVATPYDISGSANWFNKPDNCITVYPDQIDPSLTGEVKPINTEIHVTKVRFPEIGQKGHRLLRFDPHREQYLTG